MASEIKVDTIVNAGGDNDSGIDLATNDQIILKTANTTAITVDSSQDTTLAGNIKKTGDLTLDVSGDISLDANGQQIFFKKDGTTFGQIQTEATPANFTFESTVSDGDIIFKGNDGGSGVTAFTIDMSQLGGVLISPPTRSNQTSASANVVVTSGGSFAFSTSSRRYKNTINDATHGLGDLLKLRSVTYKGNNAQNDGDTIFGGLIAEEVHDAGLTEFVVYDDQNRPDSLHYGHMVALCVKAIQELSAKNDALEARIKKLEDG